MVKLAGFVGGFVDGLVVFGGGVVQLRGGLFLLLLGTGSGLGLVHVVLVLYFRDRVDVCRLFQLYFNLAVLDLALFL